MAIAALGVTVLDCPNPRALAEFYGAVLDWRVSDGEFGDGESWVELHGPDGRRLAFQKSEGYQPPRWPGTEHGQQFHLDFDVPRDRLDEAERQVLALGARLLQGDGNGKRGWRVYADPAGHPFCLCAV
ncbi:VOC family protein [Streptomyces sp. 7-21]|jgi:predicted enzyme related to lactoylglutathione lyase|uniref:VOC family protein n=1 Tax=Streptomyces sp. 7-21 TaxID=2802283 RepID=UPI00191F70B4|nr:VOC family protein [Streptomyces sp. 7-21]MBL1066246.1 VOC family protein [Streptomyces sp. 7-21]